MNTWEAKAKGELSVFTEGIWRYQDACGDLLLIPDGTFNIVVVNDKVIIDNCALDKGVYFIPVLTRSIRIKSKSPVYGLRLKIFSLHNLVRCNNIQIAQTRHVFKFELSDYFMDYLWEGIAKAQTISDCLQVMEELNYELIYKSYEVNPNLRDRVNYILDRKGNIKINEMCEAFGVSRQGLHKSFKSTLGIGPKELSAIWKLNHYMWRFQFEDRFTSCAYDAGYYDQAHSIKEFQSKLGVTPSHFVTDPMSTMSYIQHTIEKRFTNYYDPDL